MNASTAKIDGGNRADKAAVFDTLIRDRRSVRGFLPKAVPQDVLERVFNAAGHAPSNCNTQPWQLVVASGNKCDELREKISAAMMNGHILMDFPYDGKYEGVYQERQYDSANQLYSAQGITREDKAKRGEAFFRNFTFFEAPHVAFMFLPEPFGLREAADCGMYAQSIMLALVANGLASCPQTALSMHCDVVREVLGLPESSKLLFGISFGYEDSAHIANKCRVGRADLDDVVSFVS